MVYENKQDWPEKYDIKKLVTKRHWSWTWPTQKFNVIVR